MTTGCARPDGRRRAHEQLGVGVLERGRHAVDGHGRRPSTATASRAMTSSGRSTSVVTVTAPSMTCVADVVAQPHVVGLDVEVGRAELREQVVAARRRRLAPGRRRAPTSVPRCRTSARRRVRRRGRARRRRSVGATASSLGAAGSSTPVATSMLPTSPAARPTACCTSPPEHAARTSDGDQRRAGAGASAVEVGSVDGGPVAHGVDRVAGQHAAAAEQPAVLPVRQAELRPCRARTGRRPSG